MFGSKFVSFKKYIKFLSAGGLELFETFMPCFILLNHPPLALPNFTWAQVGLRPNIPLRKLPTFDRTYEIQFLCPRMNFKLIDTIKATTEGHNKPLRNQKNVSRGGAGCR